MVVYTVSYSFQNIGSGYNTTNFSTGTTYINNIKSNKIILNGTNVDTTLTSLQTQINNFKPFLTGNVVIASSISAGSIMDIQVTIPNFPYTVSSISPVIQCTINNKVNVVYINNCNVQGISFVSGSQFSNYVFNIRVTNTYPTTTIPANSCYIGYTIFSN